mmetsp:Transcript_61931/g.170184  ORF Transcript_61931/g.170184 Transcript_61931/m.170184 type:complete len:206 (-) Transcript_61931:167-784(-)
MSRCRQVLAKSPPGLHASASRRSKGYPGGRLGVCRHPQADGLPDAPHRTPTDAKEAAALLAHMRRAPLRINAVGLQHARRLGHCRLVCLRIEELRDLRARRGGGGQPATPGIRARGVCARVPRCNGSPWRRRRGERPRPHPPLARPPSRWCGSAGPAGSGGTRRSASSRAVVAAVHAWRTTTRPSRHAPWRRRRAQSGLAAQMAR